MDERLPEETHSNTEKRYRRTVRSYVLRAGRVTEGQQRALDELWPVFGVETGDRVLDFAALFGNDRPVVMEIGFGDGEATWRMAESHPEENYLGIEVHKPGVGRLLLRIEEHGLQNVRIICDDAVDVLRSRVPEDSLDGVRIYFPDPWPKKRHHKRRIIQPSFVSLLAARMRSGGVLHLATDWEPYAEFMLEVMQQSPEFENLSQSGGYCARPEWRPLTKFEQRGERLGHKVADLLYRRRERETKG